LRGKWLKTVTLETPASCAMSATVTMSNPRSRNNRAATSAILLRVFGPPRAPVLGMLFPSSEVATGVGIAVTILAALFTGTIATSSWSAQQTAGFQEAVTIAGLTLTAAAAAFVGWGIVRAQRVANGQPSTSVGDPFPA